jgi:hypothetical protein
MDTNYTIVGSDGQQYGPIPLANLKTWIAEGRVHAQTQVLRSDINSWLPAAQYPELGLAAAPQSSTPPRFATTGTVDVATAQLARRVKSGADWFFWIAGLSLINSVIGLTGSGGGFAIGLGITLLISAFGQGLGAAGNAVALGLDILVVGVFVVFGVFARKGHTWSFIVGMVLYGLDGLLLLLIGGGMLSDGIHAFALFCIFVGLKANLELKSGGRAA